MRLFDVDGERFGVAGVARGGVCYIDRDRGGAAGIGSGRVDQLAGGVDFRRREKQIRLIGCHRDRRRLTVTID